MIGEGDAMRAALALVPALLLASPTDAAERRFSVTSFEKIRVEGPYDVALSVGASPFAKASGDWAAIDRLSMTVEGTTLVIRPPAGVPVSAAGQLKITVATPGLRSATLNGAGRLRIDKLRGLSFDLVAVGAGMVEVGAMEVDQLTVGLSGAATGRLAGKAKSVNALVKGASTLDASGLRSADVKIGAEGSAVARLHATNSAKIQAAGPVTVDVAGGPACTVKSLGSASVSGC